MHLFAIFNVAVSSSLSAMWIMIANSWMQTPAGIEYRNGIFYVTDWPAALFNPNALAAFPHIMLASFELSLGFVIAVCAWSVLRHRHVALFLRPLKYALGALIVVAVARSGLATFLASRRLTANRRRWRPWMAMDGHYDTTDKDGKVDTDWHIIGWPNAKGDGLAWSIPIPHALSLLETKTCDGAVKG